MDNILEFYPFRAMQHEMNNGLVTVLFINPNPTFIEKIFFKKQIKKPYKIELDEFGSFIWNLCDGKSNLKKIAEKLEDEFGDKVSPVENRVTEFINQMSKNKLINLFEKK